MQQTTHLPTKFISMYQFMYERHRALPLKKEHKTQITKSASTYLKQNRHRDTFNAPLQTDNLFKPGGFMMIIHQFCHPNKHGLLCICERC